MQGEEKLKRMDCWEQARVAGALHVDISSGECCNRGSTTGQETGSSRRAEETMFLFGFLACVIYNIIGCMATHHVRRGIEKRCCNSTRRGSCFENWARLAPRTQVACPAQFVARKSILGWLATVRFRSSKPHDAKVR